MRYFLKALSLAILITTFYSCSDDSGTTPSDEFLGATFQFEDGQTWDYERYFIEEEGDELFGNAYYKVESNGLLFGKESFKYFSSQEKEDLGEGKFTYVSTSDDGYFSFLINGFENFIQFFPELNNQWIKQIDFKNESWNQFDLQLDSTLDDGTKLSVIFKNNGSKVQDTEVEYENEIHQATIYKFEFESLIQFDDIILEDFQSEMEITVIDEIGIYKGERSVFGGQQQSYEILINHK